MKIAILDDYQDAVRQLPCFDLLREHEVKVFRHSAAGLGQLAIRLAPFEALVLIRERTHLSRALLQRLPNLKLISQTGKLAGHVDVAAASACGITITEGVGDPTAPAELTWALIMAASRQLNNYASLLQQGLWQTSSSVPAYNRLGRVLQRRTLGIWGYGKIGRLVAGYARAFGMPVQVWAREASREAARADGHAVATSQQEFYASCDVLSLHMRLVPATRGVVKAADLAAMKPTALFVNTSRAGLVEPGALVEALRRVRPGMAAVDVFEDEPLTDPAHPLLQMDNVVCTPHIGYVTRDEFELQFSDIFDQINAFAAGRPINVVNPQVLAGLRPAGAGDRGQA